MMIDAIKIENAATTSTAMPGILSCRAMIRDEQIPHHYYAGGSGTETLVIVNAYGKSLAFWDLLVTAIVDRCRVLIWQPRGSSSQNGEMQDAWSLAHHVRDMEAILDAEGIMQAHIIGWHSGSKTALEFYAKNPQRVASMMFLSGCFVHDTTQTRFCTRYENAMHTLCGILDKEPCLAEHVKELLNNLLAYLPDDAMQDVSDDSSHQSESDEAELALISDIKSMVFEPFRTTHSIVNYAHQMRLFWRNDISNLLSLISIPTLFIDGESDNISSMALTETVAAQVPRSIYIQVKGGTHYMQCDNHRLIGAIIVNFLEKGYQFDLEHTALNKKRMENDIPALESGPLSRNVKKRERRTHSDGGPIEYADV